MGGIHLNFTVANLTHPDRKRNVSFLVDTGATLTWLSKEIAEDLALEPMGTIPLELADGNVTEQPYAFCLFDYDGETMAGNAVIGPSGCEPLVGSHVLQDFRLVIDLGSHAITRAQAMRAKRTLNNNPAPQAMQLGKTHKM